MTPETRDTEVILLVDDDPLIGELVRLGLAMSGYRVMWCERGADAHRLARTLQPRVVILDLVMPGVSGVEVLHAIRADPATATLPVIVLSGATDLLGPDERALAQAVLWKPFSPAELARVVAQVSSA